ncbi:hypothetical protein IWX49DRAFT_395917 [Phyllosticta citricarpa]|uniref:Uncharacterized protein n=2 Tax=Phyllosticta TaxID=121621 RepID=A0ABR1MCJ3_9PEZI
MPSRPRHEYMTVSDLNAEREAVPWYWRVTALLATWMIFGGYVIMTPLFHDNPNDMIAIDPKILTIFVIALFIVGYSLTGIVCVAVKSWEFQTESVFLPTITSSALGLLTALYNFLVYQHTQWNAATIIAIVLSAGMSIIYTVFFFLTTRRISKLRAKLTAERESTNAILQPETTPYDAWIANMFPSVRRLPPDYIPPAEHEPYRPYYRTEEEVVNEQFAKLLKQREQESRLSPAASTSTFRIDLPQNDESDNEASPNARRTGTLRGMLRPQIPARSHGQLPHGHTLHEYYAVGASSVPGQLQDWNRGRSSARTETGAPRTKSREERRTEIELGRMSS